MMHESSSKSDTASKIWQNDVGRTIVTVEYKQPHWGESVTRVNTGLLTPQSEAQSRIPEGTSGF